MRAAIGYGYYSSPDIVMIFIVKYYFEHKNIAKIKLDTYFKIIRRPYITESVLFFVF